MADAVIVGADSGDELNCMTEEKRREETREKKREQTEALQRIIIKRDLQCCSLGPLFCQVPAAWRLVRHRVTRELTLSRPGRLLATQQQGRKMIEKKKKSRQTEEQMELHLVVRQDEY